MSLTLILTQIISMKMSSSFNLRLTVSIIMSLIWGFSMSSYSIMRAMSGASRQDLEVLQDRTLRASRQDQEGVQGRIWRVSRQDVEGFKIGCGGAFKTGLEGYWYGRWRVSRQDLEKVQERTWRAL
ncbi:unnamed protein product [Nesidiocoris tenuis]|uniref:Uncharacterized protein n=1 Tax=Nesidiocoris tenuis TaxID=355587 RepID=A0A6H5GVN1_9HEMI|nr:unnamed protein product [Nesidiocoris tenuis]CAB0007031.1 unnamed protein product [Nesidiocoris tenuis]